MRAGRLLVAGATLGIVLTGPTLGASAQTAPRAERGIVYSSPGGVPLRLDAYLPGSPGPHPAVVLIHGGAWREGDRTLEGNWYATAFVDAGFAVFAVDYRLAPEHPFPAAVHDVRAAVAWVRAHAAEYDVDPAAIAAFGDSAGGHLAAMLAVLGTGPLDEGSRVQAAVSWSGPMDLAALVRDRGDLVISGHDDPFRLTARDIVEQFLGCRGASCARPYRDASPVSFVDPSDAPMLLVNSVDEVIPIAQAREMADRLRAEGVPVRSIELAGDAHAVDYAEDPVPGSSASVLEVSISFLHERLSGSPTPTTEPSGRGSQVPVVAGMAFAVAILAGSLLLRGPRARQARSLVPLTSRTIRWLPLAPIVAIGYAAIWISFHGDPSGASETHLSFGGFLLAVWLGFALDDPTAETTAPVPTPLLLRRAVRVAVTIPAACAIWSLLLLSAHRAGFVGLSLSLSFAAQLMAALAFGALGARTAGEERAGMTAGGGLVVLFGVVPVLLRLPSPLFEPAGSTWMQLYGRSLVIGAISLLAFIVLSLDRPRRRSFRIGRGPRRAPARGWVG